MMNSRRVINASPAASQVAWWFTLAHAETPASALALPGAQLDELIAYLQARGQPVAPALRAHARLRERTARSGEKGLRYLWAFRRLHDALLAARANHRSDYHAYPCPATLREASLDRLYRRFPLSDYPQTTLLLITGAQVCADPLLGPDPDSRSLAAILPGALAPAAWDRYTLCGFEHGAALISVLPSDRWLRISLPALEDAWAAATRQSERQHEDQPRLRGAPVAAASAGVVEQAALARLLSDRPDSAFALVSEPASGATSRTTRGTMRGTMRGAIREGRDDRAGCDERAHAGQPA